MRKTSFAICIISGRAHILIQSTVADAVNRIGAGLFISYPLSRVLLAGLPMGHSMRLSPGAAPASPGRGAPSLPDPLEWLEAFQQALTAGAITLQPGALDRAVYVHLDRPGGYPRVTFARQVQRIVTAFAVYVPIEPIKNIPTYAIGYAVPERFRCKGLAKSIVASSSQEMSVALAHHNIRGYYIEAMVPIANLASQRVAAATLTDVPVPFTDTVSGEPWLQYLRLMR